MAPKVTPLTTSPLSQESRQTIAGSGNVFSGVNSPAVMVAPQPTVTDVQTLQLTQQNQQNLVGLQVGLDEVRRNVLLLNSGLQNISVLLQNDITNDQNILLSQQNQDRLLAEQGLRSGQERDIEEKINRSFSIAAQPIARKTSGLFDRIGQSLLYLFGGWLISNVGELIESQSKGNTDLVTKIKNKLLEGIRNAINVLLLLKGGIGTIVNSIVSASKVIGSVLIGKPFRALKNLLQGAAATKNIPRGGGRTGNVPKGPGFIGGVLTALGVGLEAAEGNYTEAIIGAVSLTPLGRIARLAGLVYNAEQLLDLIGVGLIDEKPKETEESTNNTTTSPTTTEQNTGVESNKPNTNVTIEESESNQNPSNENYNNVEPTTQKSLNEEELKLYNKAWNQRNLPFAKGKIRGEFNNLSPEKQILFIEHANQQGHDWGNIIPKAKSANVQSSSNLTNTSNSSQEVTSTTTTNASPMAEAPTISSTPNEPVSVTEVPTISSTPNEPVSVTEAPIINPNPESRIMKDPVARLPKSKPIIITNTSQSSSPTSVSIQSDDSMTDIPIIASSNPENFYTLYSLHSYNVVV